jgi:uncharacterized DUF497 family protein
VAYAWDARKAAANLSKHGVRFAEATAVFEDPHALTQDQPGEEERYVTMGLDGFGRLLVVAYAWRGEEIRLISARKATAHERLQYRRRR